MAFPGAWGVEGKGGKENGGVIVNRNRLEKRTRDFQSR
jgi:hypothetical protein